jgi:hypothetical protein
MMRATAPAALMPSFGRHGGSPSRCFSRVGHALHVPRSHPLELLTLA